MINFVCSDGIQKTLIIRGEIEIRTTTPDDWSYLNKLMKEESSCIGFLQQRTWDRYVWGGERNFVTLLCLRNHQPVGYCFFTPGKGANRPVKIQQLVVQKDCRRIEHGTALCDSVADFAKQNDRSGISLRCRADLEANDFWEALGFKLVRVVSKGAINHVGMKASNDIFQYHRQIGADLFETPIIYTEQTSITDLYNPNLSLEEEL